MQRPWSLVLCRKQAVVKETEEGRGTLHPFHLPLLCEPRSSVLRRIRAFLGSLRQLLRLPQLLRGVYVEYLEIRVFMIVAQDPAMPIHRDGDFTRQPESFRHTLEVDLAEINLCGLPFQRDFRQRLQQVRAQAEDLVVLGIDPGEALGKGGNSDLALLKRPVQVGLGRVLREGDNISIPAIDFLASEITKRGLGLIDRMKDQRSRREPGGQHEAFRQAAELARVAGQIGAILTEARPPGLSGRYAKIVELLVLLLAALSVAFQLLLVDLLQRTGIGEVAEKLPDVLAYGGENR